jgi:glycosyltransferase involved in cell wall biosynthesis
MPKRILQGCIHPPYQTVSFEDIKKKYQLQEEYFFCPNQFWAHKNHLVVLEAIKKLESSHNRKIKVVFTGKLHDFRTPGYHNEIIKYINENNIADNVLMLGFIDRKEQLQIMKHALAVIQPSLFEGWSTIVEDTKAMNQNIIVSDIPVHKEQLAGKTIYFDPKNSDSLVGVLKNFKKSRVEFDYRANQLKFGSEFLKIAVE